MKKKKDIHEECYDLSYTFMRWINKYLKVYREDASKCIDMEFHKVEHKGETYTFKELLDKLIDLTDEFIKVQDNDWWDKSLDLLKNDIFDIFKEIYWLLWW